MMKDTQRAQTIKDALCCVCGLAAVPFVIIVLGVIVACGSACMGYGLNLGAHLLNWLFPALNLPVM
jgi:hypothetical protein